MTESAAQQGDWTCPACGKVTHKFLHSCRWQGRYEMTGKSIADEVASTTDGGRTHHLKTWPEFYAEVEAGRKTVDVRRDDRGFQVGDTLVLEEWDPDLPIPRTGRSMRRLVTHVLRGWGVEDGYAALSITSAHHDRGSGRSHAAQTLIDRVCCHCDDCMTHFGAQHMPSCPLYPPKETDRG